MDEKIWTKNNCFYSIFHDDCFDFINKVENNSIHLVLIDPPYAISRNTNFQNGDPKNKDTDRFRISMDFGKWDENEVQMEELFKLLFPKMKDGATIICFYDLWKIGELKKAMENAGFKQIRFIEWLKTNPVPINSKINYLTNAREAAVIGVKKRKGTFNSEYDKGVYEYPICHDKGRFHPTQKPVELIKELIEKHSNPGDLVMDCFFGSGTTCIACIETERDFIGCELDDEYYEKAKERIEKAIED